MYLSNGPRAKAKVGIKVGIGVLEAAEVQIGVSLLSVKAFPASLFLPIRAELRQVLGPVI